MEGYKSKGGVGLLELALGKMYHDPMVIYREYIQNSCDSLEEAVRANLIKTDEKNIIITINQSRHQIIFEDCGIGVSNHNIGEALVDIGNSKKSSDLIGQYGIGRLIAARYCDRIVFETSAKGEPVMSKLIWDTKKAFEIIDNKSDKEFTHIIDEVTTASQHKEDIDSHFFRVTIDNVNDFDLLDENRAYDYIAQTAPLDYSFEFKDEVMKSALKDNQDYEKLMNEERKYNISLNEKDIRKLYKYEFDDIRLTTPSFFSIEDRVYGRMAWGWYSLSQNITQMNDVIFRGIRLRKHNMAIGLESILTEYFPKNVDAFYFVGEIYIIHSNIEPSGSRDGIGVSTVASAFKDELKKKCKELHDLYTKTYRFGNQLVKKISDGYYEIQKDKAQLKQEESNEEKKKLREKISQKKNEVVSIVSEIKNKKTELEAKDGYAQLIHSYTEYIDNTLKDKVDKYNSSKTKNKKARIKWEPVSEISEGYKQNLRAEDPETEYKKRVDPLDSLSKPTRLIIKVVKKVIDSETTLTDSIKEKLINNIVKKLRNK